MERYNQSYEKKQVRAYHYVKASLPQQILFVMITFVPFLLFLFSKNGMITQWISEWAGSMMNRSFDIQYSVREMDFIPFFKLRFLDVEGTLPSQEMTIVTAIAAAAVILLVYLLGKGRGPLTFFGIISVAVLLVSAVYFYFFGEQFPYELTDYSSLYMTQQIVSWLAIGLIMSLVLALYGKAALPALLTYYAMIAYCFALGSLRYLFYLLILHYASSLFMAPLFFTLGVFWDFLFVVCMYSLFSRQVSRKYRKEGDKVWKR